MADVPLPHPVMNAMLGDDWEDLFTADQMHAHAAAVSAAKDAEISRLKHRIALHDPCNGRMAGEPPRYTPECVVLRAEVAGLRAWLEADARCPCCDTTDACVDGCTFANDCPQDAERMAEVRALLAARKGEA